MIDGWRITVAPAERQALLSSWAEIGWRVGTFVAGAGALYLADAFGWRAAYLCMAAAMVPGLIARPAGARTRIGQDRVPRASRLHRDRLGAHQGVDRAPRPDGRSDPRSGGRVPHARATSSSAMAMPLFKSLHYSNADIATVTKLFGFWVALGGTFLAAYVVPRIGMMASLFVGTVFGSASHLSLAYLAAHGGHGGSDFWTFAAAVSIDNFAYAFASIVLITYMSRLAATEHAASQYALLTSLCALPGEPARGRLGLRHRTPELRVVLRLRPL